MNLLEGISTFLICRVVRFGETSLDCEWNVLKEMSRRISNGPSGKCYTFGQDMFGVTCEMTYWYEGSLALKNCDKTPFFPHNAKVLDGKCHFYSEPNCPQDRFVGKSVGREGCAAVTEARAHIMSLQCWV